MTLHPPLSSRRLLPSLLGLSVCVLAAASAAGQPPLPGSPGAHPAVHVGRVVIEPIDEGIVIAVDERRNGGPGDEIAEVVYLLQQERPGEIREDLELAQVRVWPRSVEVHPVLGGAGWVFALEDAAPRPSAQPLERIEGYGLARHEGHRVPLGSGGLLDVSALSGPLQKDPSAPGSGGGCESGGIGATQCSQGCADGTSCGISCMSGYVPCCTCTVTGARCRCSPLP